MRLKRLIKDCLPPVLFKIRDYYKNNRALYESYEAVLNECTCGYEENDLVNVVFEKTKIYRESLFARDPFMPGIAPSHILAGLSLAARDKKLNVIDFGGACGAHYFAIKKALGESIDIRWHVVETPGMALRGAELKDGNLSFSDNIKDARKSFDHVHLIFSSGTLQYVPRPYETLELLIECKAENMFFVNTGLSDLPKELIIKQKSTLGINGPGPLPEGMQDKEAYYPATFIRKDRFEEILQKSYLINSRSLEKECLYLADGKPVNGYGYFASIKA